MVTTPPPAILRHWMAGPPDAFSPRTRGRVLTLVAGAIPAPGRRTVASAPRVMGLAEAPAFASYRRVPNRNGWSGRELPRRASWYAKPELTFSDAPAAVRQRLWRPEGLATSRPGNDVAKVSRALLERLTGTLCYAA